MPAERGWFPCLGKKHNAKHKKEHNATIREILAVAFFYAKKGEDEMINWKAKLTSRKLWVAVAEFVGMLLLVVFGVAEETIEKVVALIMSGAGALAFVIAEGLVDANAAATVIATTELEPAEEEAEE